MQKPWQTTNRCELPRNVAPRKIARTSRLKLTNKLLCCCSTQGALEFVSLAGNVQSGLLRKYSDYGVVNRVKWTT